MKSFLVSSWLLLSYLISPEPKKFTFNFPGEEKTTTIELSADGFHKFKKEIQGTDCYYSGSSDSDILLSVLYYKLTASEKIQLVDAMVKLLHAPENSPIMPSTYFFTYSNTKKYETSGESWGDPISDFMFRQFNIKEFEGIKVNQKNMYGYCMFNGDLFVSIHLSKLNYSPQDSIEMRNILASLSKIKN